MQKSAEVILSESFLTFINKISCSLSKPDQKFISDMVKQLYEWFILEAGGIRKTYPQKEKGQEKIFSFLRLFFFFLQWISSLFRVKIFSIFGEEG